MPGPFYKCCFPWKILAKTKPKENFVRFVPYAAGNKSLHACQIFSQYSRTVRSTKNSGEAAMFIRDMRFHASRSR